MNSSAASFGFLVSRLIMNLGTCTLNLGVFQLETSNRDESAGQQSEDSANKRNGGYEARSWDAGRRLAFGH